jgi:A/G-specific adenine glycosylase
MLEQNRKAITTWYQQHHRKLPWRETKDAYRIWLSEIILQQTRVQQGLPYYNKFIESYPSIHKLAQAQETEVLHLWQGLGYYSRARNMHFTAKYIVKNYDGIFPSDYKNILSLKGIGEYTAAAIASFAFNLPFAAVDGNVMRVISRLYGIEEDINLGTTKKAVTTICNEMMNDRSPALFNQSMMEFGAIQCKASSPDCSICPLQETCFAYLNNKVNQLPFKINKTKVRNRYFNYLIIRSNSGIYIQQRKGKGIWQNLYEFPLLERKSPLSEVELLKELRQYSNSCIKLKYRSKEIKHKLSHQLLHIQFNVIECDSIKPEKNWQLVPISQIDSFPFPEIINKHKATFK